MIDAQTVSKLMGFSMAYAEVWGTLLKESQAALQKAELHTLSAGHFNRAMRYQHMLGGLTLGQVHISGHLPNASAQLLQDDSLLAQTMDMQLAIARRVAAMGQSWLEGVIGISKQAVSSQHVNTMDKLVEGDMNAMLQFGNLITTQTTALTQLMLGIQVGTGRMLSAAR